MPTFSQRIGVKPVKTVLQLDSMDDDLKNSLWNVCYDYHLRHLVAKQFDGPAHYICGPLWRDFFKLPLNEIPPWEHMAMTVIKSFYFEKASWGDVYDLIEFMANLSLAPSDFTSSCNCVLEREMSGYRFSGMLLTPITDEQELATISKALEILDPWKLARLHIKAGVELFSDRKSPDYRNSIKESISAVEAMCRIITGQDDATLGQALNRLQEKGIALHSALKKSSSSLYGYTSDAEGIRHALLEESTLDFDDAKFMLVSCSAFVNYLAAKASKAGAIHGTK